MGMTCSLQGMIEFILKKASCRVVAACHGRRVSVVLCLQCAMLNTHLAAFAIVPDMQVTAHTKPDLILAE